MFKFVVLSFNSCLTHYSSYVNNLSEVWILELKPHAQFNKGLLTISENTILLCVSILKILIICNTFFLRHPVFGHTKSQMYPWVLYFIALSFCNNRQLSILLKRSIHGTSRWICCFNLFVSLHFYDTVQARFRDVHIVSVGV